MTLALLDHKSWIGATEAGRRLGVSNAYVCRLADRGLLRCVRTPIGRLVSAASVDELKAERAKRQAKINARPD